MYIFKLTVENLLIFYVLMSYKKYVTILSSLTTNLQPDERLAALSHVISFARQAVRLTWHLTNRDTVPMSLLLLLFEKSWSFCETSKCFLWHVSGETESGMS